MSASKIFAISLEFYTHKITTQSRRNRVIFLFHPDFVEIEKKSSSVDERNSKSYHGVNFMSTNMISSTRKQ
jgi:hypothetical protein